MQLVRPTVEKLGFELWGVEQLGNGRRRRLCVYIEANDGITFENCETVSKQLMLLLEVEHALANTQTLEVSSPGMDRKLFNRSQYVQHVGEEVDVRLHFAIEGNKRIRGIMSACNDDDFVVDEHHIEFDKVRSTRIIPRFD